MALCGVVRYCKGAVKVLSSAVQLCSGDALEKSRIV